MADARADILVFSTVEQLRRVLPNVDADGKSSLECTRCGKRLPNRSARRLHMEKVHRVHDEAWSSLNAELGAVGVAKADEHRLRFVCPVVDCARKTVHASAKLLVQHFQKNHTDKQFGCPLGCRARFGLQRDLNYHLKRHHAEETTLPKRATSAAILQKAKRREAQSASTLDGLYCLVPLKQMIMMKCRRIAPKPSVSSTSTQTEISVCKFGGDDYFHGEGLLTAHTQTDECFSDFVIPEQQERQHLINGYTMGRSFAHAESQSNLGFESGGNDGPITEDFSQQCSFVSIPSENCVGNRGGMGYLLAADESGGYVSDGNYGVYVVDPTASEDRREQTHCRNCSATAFAVDRASMAASTFQTAEAEPYYQDSFAQTVYPQTVDFGTQYCGGGGGGFMDGCLLDNCSDDRSAQYYHDVRPNCQQQRQRPMERHFVHVAVGPDFSA